jgi:hypothetical protein
MTVLRLGVVGLLIFVALKSFSTFRHLVYILDASQIPDPFIYQKQEKLDNCNVPMQAIKSITGVHDFATASAIIAAHDEPLLFKRYIKNPAEKWATIEATTKDTSLTYDVLELNGFGNMWLGGATKTKESVNATIREVLDMNVDPNAKTAVYSSFSTFLDLDHPSVKDETIPSSIVKDTNFISNFPQDIMATPLHSAPSAASFSIQYVGRKLWVLAPPRIMETFDCFSTPPTKPLKGSEKQYFEQLRKKGLPLLHVPQEEGDLFYFPPLWGHAVVTKAGPNVMLNFRRVALVGPIINFPFRILEAFVATLFMTPVYTHRRGSSTDNRLAELAYPYRHSGENFDSSCMDEFKAILNK